MRLDRLTIKAQAVGVAALLTASSLVGAAPQPAPQDEAISIKATVDKTQVELGSPFTLTITIAGDASKSELQPFEFPSGVHVVVQRRATNVSLQLGHVQRAVSLVYVLMATTPGMVHLGPFQLTHQGNTLQTDPIEIVVNKPVLPPSTKEQQRITL